MNVNSLSQIRKVRSGGTKTTKPGQCQKCLEFGHWTFDCKGSLLFSIFDEISDKADVIGISYAGHTNHAKAILSLQEQVQHKIDCLYHIKKIYPVNTKFYLIGHSLGTFISKCILQADTDLQFDKIISLFPTLYGMEDSPNGSFLKRISHPTSAFILAHIIALLSLLPNRILLKIVKSTTDLSESLALESVKHLVNKYSVQSILYLGRHELREISDLDDETIKTISKHQQKWIMYFGTTDKWVPISYYERIKSTFPGADIILCNQEISHAFVNGYSMEIAAKVVKWLNIQ
jgi:hypothetical protein